ncbi:MAG TPA: hypothetical protein VFC78_04015 [Tepidisphaeraceae bacterium]|nr:hypothetical protein [Tepidisphaeraceae bacterium]
MKRKPLLAIFLLTLQCILIPVVRGADPQPEAPPLPTLEEAHAAFAAGQYPTVLQSLNRIAESRQWTDGIVDHYDLLMLRGHTYIQLKESSAAQSAFAQAAKAATDKKKAAAATVLQLLIRQSPGFKYPPRPAKKEDKPDPIDIIDPAKRADALKTFLADERLTVRPKLEAASQATSLLPIMKAVPAIKRLHTIELGVTGDDSWTTDFSAGLAKHAHELMYNAMYVMHGRIDGIRKSAMTLIPVIIARRGGPINPYSPPTGARQRGLDDRQSAELRGDIAACDKFPEAARELTAAFATDPKYYKDVCDQAKGLSDWAGKILQGINLDYDDKK